MNKLPEISVMAKAAKTTKKQAGEESPLKISLAGRFSPETNSTLVVFSSSKKQDKKNPKEEASGPTVTLSHKVLGKLLSEEIEQKNIQGKFEEAVLFRRLNFEGFQNVLVVGLGSQLDAEKVRQTGAHLCAKLSGMSHVEVQFDGVASSKKQAAGFLQAFVEGILLASYKFDELKSDKKSDKKTLDLRIVSSNASDAQFKNAFHQAEVICECVNFSKRLGDMPGNLMTPEILADSTAKAASGTGLKVEIWDRARIKKEKMGGLYGVGQGSEQEPRFIIMRYSGAAKTKKPIVFVGKGLTFDTGGISIKPGASMEEMKYDMCGGANVIGALLAIAKLKLDVNAIGLVPASENMPGGAATKPGDVHTARNGKTFEVNNTDAEGRLILSDALCFGSEQEPQMMVDAATLTGAMVVALGNIHTGYFTKNESLRSKIETAAKNSGELVWQMPLVDHHTKDMKGTFADLSNISSGKGAGSATAAAFLEQFVEEGIPWAHFDIAGTAWATGNRLPYCTKKGASGVMVRTFLELARLFE